jgi:hypothetical protein
MYHATVVLVIGLRYEDMKHIHSSPKHSRSTIVMLH